VLLLALKSKQLSTWSLDLKNPGNEFREFFKRDDLLGIPGAKICQSKLFQKNFLDYGRLAFQLKEQSIQ
jgi:hypothetical protein